MTAARDAIEQSRMMRTRSGRRRHEPGCRGKLMIPSLVLLDEDVGEADACRPDKAALADLHHALDEADELVAKQAHRFS